MEGIVWGEGKTPGLRWGRVGSQLVSVSRHSVCVHSDQAGGHEADP